MLYIGRIYKRDCMPIPFYGNFIQAQAAQVAWNKAKRFPWFIKQGDALRSDIILRFRTKAEAKYFVSLNL